MTFDPGESSPRYVPEGSCPWCGHPPHDGICKAKIRLGKKQIGPCPCKQ